MSKGEISTDTSIELLNALRYCLSYLDGYSHIDYKDLIEKAEQELSA